MTIQRLRSWLLFAPVCFACNGTSTGNPMNEPPDSGGPPDGATLLKSSLARDTTPQLTPANAATLGVGNRAFAFDLYKALATEGGNLFLSPFSVSVALAMTYPGARGQTATEIANVLHFDLPQPVLHSAFNATLRTLDGRSAELAPKSTGDGFKLSIVNQAWGQQGYPFLDAYLDVLAQNYGAGLFAVQFGASEATRQLINGWVSDQTETRIKDLLPPASLTSDTRLVLTNAIYFKASWLSKFDANATLDGLFHAPQGERTVPMMRQVVETQYGEGDNYQALELPYVSPSVKMLLVLPAEGAFDSVVSGIDEAFFQDLRGRLGHYDVTVTLPKFQFETKSRLKGPLIELGMPAPFQSADFSGIAGGIESLVIDEVYHNTFVAVDEQGTEAAAATAVVIGTESATPSAEISFDRPFVFAIYDEPTGQVLFIGHLQDPG
jgi:serpin B